MKAGQLTYLLICCCIVWMFTTDVQAQEPGLDLNRPQRTGKLDLDRIWGRCGCENCNGRLIIHEPYEEKEEGSGSSDFVLVNRWSATATNGGGLIQGDPTILTWSIVPDGTDANGGGGFVPSNLISVFDNLFNEPNAGDPDLTNRFWHGLIEQSLDRWGELSGIVYVYEPNDDGVANFGASGFLGVRGDVRIGGFNIDGPNGVLAFNDLPNVGDMAIDTSDTGLFGNSGAGFRLFRNVFTHEQGHGTGILHLESNNANFLMEPFISGAFDGPQLDDVLAIQRHYGDVNEKSNDFEGNNTIPNATDLGLIPDMMTQTIGVDGATGTVVAGNDDDFVSVDDNSDFDYYRIELPQSAFLTITLTPVGAGYNQSQQGGGGGIPTNPSGFSNLTLALFDSNGALIIQSNSGGFGDPEVIEDQQVSGGDWFIRISGSANNVQLYTLSVLAEYGTFESTPPDQIDFVAGSSVSGSLNDLADSDDNTLDIIPESASVPSEAIIDAFMTFTLPTSTPEDFSLTLEGVASTLNLSQVILIRNVNTNQFELVDFRDAPVAEESITITPTGDPTRFVDLVSGEVVVNIQYLPVGPVTGFPWVVKWDQLVINTID